LGSSIVSPDGGPGQHRPGVAGEREVPSIVFSPDGSRSAYTALKDDKWYAIIDGQPSPPNEALGKRPPLFSVDSRHVVYVAKIDGKFHAVVDGMPDAGYKEILEKGLVILPDGTVQYLALATRIIPGIEHLKLDAKTEASMQAPIVTRVRHVLSK
jgi:hypothetical protein